MINRRWTEEEYEFLRANYAKLSNIEIARKLGRTKYSVASAVKMLGLRRPTSKWTEEEMRYIRDNYLYMDYSEIAHQLRRTRESVQKKIMQMGLKKTSDRTRLADRNVIPDENRLTSLRLRLCRVADICSDCMKGWGMTEETTSEEITLMEQQTCSPCMYSHESRKLIDEIDALEAAVREERKKRRKRA